MTEITGGCRCGAVRYAYNGTPRWQGYCHCASCRHATGAPIAAYVGVPAGQWRWTGAAPSAWASSKGVDWLFCGTCGAPIAYFAERYAGEIHFHATSLDDPTNFAPQAHFHYEEHLPWLTLTDDLPRHIG